MLTVHRGKRMMGTSDTHCSTHLTHVLVLLHFVPVGMKTTFIPMKTVGQKRGMNGLSLCIPMCGLFFQKETIFLGTEDQRKPLCCRVDMG